MDQLENQMANETLHWNKENENSVCWWISGNTRLTRCHLEFSACERRLCIFPLIIAWLPITFLSCSMSCLPTSADEGQMGHWVRVGISKLIHLCQAHCCEFTKHTLSVISLTWWGFTASIQNASKRNSQ